MKRYELFWWSVASLLTLGTPVMLVLLITDAVPWHYALMWATSAITWMIFGAVPLIVSARRTTNLDVWRRAMLNETERLSMELPTEMPYRMVIGAGADEGELVLSTVEEKSFGYRLLLRVLRELGVRVEH